MRRYYIHFLWLLLVWLLLTVITLITLNSSQLEQELEIMKVQLERAETENQKVTSILSDIKKKLQLEREARHKCEFALKPDNVQEPSLRYERTRRKIIKDVNGLWYYIKSRLSRMKDNPTERTVSMFEGILEDVSDRWRVIIGDLHVLTENDGFDRWRQLESQRLSNIIQNKLQVSLLRAIPFKNKIVGWQTTVLYKYPITLLTHSQK